MRLAVAGKGGAGKTTISATAARLLARSGRPVVAVDADSNPNLHAALGLRTAAPAAGYLPTSLVSRRLNGPALTVPLEEVLERHAVAAPDGVRLLRMGAPAHADEGCLCGAHATVSALLADLGERPEVTTIIDLEASPEHLSRGTARHADVLLLVAEPYYRSLEAVRLQADLASETDIGRIVVVANKCRNPGDADAIGEFCDHHGLELDGAIPWSEPALAADAAGIALLDHAPSDAAVTAIAALAQRLTAPALIGAPLATTASPSVGTPSGAEVVTAASPSVGSPARPPVGARINSPVGAPVITTASPSVGFAAGPPVGTSTAAGTPVGAG